MTLLTPESTTVTPLSPDMMTEQEARRQQEETNVKVAGATGILALGNIASRILGLIRETVLTFLFGASPQVEAFLVATLVPRALYDLLIGGHVNGAIVPVLSEIVTLKGREELWKVLSILMSLITVGLAILVLVIEVFASHIVALTASGANPYTQMMATDLLRITAPALIFMGLFAIFSGTLYALKSFTLPAFAGVVFNGSIALITLIFVPGHELTMSLTYSPFMPYTLARPQHAITIVAISWLLGGAMQMGLQLFGLQLSRLRFVLDWRHPALRSIALLYAPVMFSLIIDTLIIRPVSYNLASNTGQGSIAYMNWATTLIQFPQGLVATAISLAILPTLASQALGLDKNRAFKDTLGLGLRLTTTLIVPATIGLFVLAHPIVALLFEHGEFTAGDTNITALALRMYLIGLPFAALDLLLVYAFYARKDTVTPAVVGVASFVVYIGVAVTLLPRYGLYSLMIADSMKHISHALISGIILRARVNGFGKQRLIETALKSAAAGLVMGIAGALLLPILTRLVGGGGEGFVREAAVVVIVGGVCAVVYVRLALAFHIEELRWLSGLLKQRVLRA